MLSFRFNLNYKSHKSSQYYLEHGEKIENATTVTQRKTLQTESGVTGISILFELFHLRDMVIDRMHLTFNMLKREFMTKIWAEIGGNAGKLIDARAPALSGLIDRNEFGNALEERAKGVAKLKSLTDKLGSWKSNEFKKFSEIAREVLSELIPSEAYDCFMLLCQAVQMLYSKELKIVMMYPVLGNTGNPNYYLCIDYKNAELVKTIKVPIYPDVDETVRVKGTGNQEWYGKLNQEYVTERKARVQWYRETRRNGIWTVTNGEDDIYFRSIIGLTITERVFGGFRITDVS